MNSVAVQLSLSAAQLLIQLIGQFIESKTDNAQTQTIINAILQWMPIIVKAFPQFAANFQQFISILMGDETLTDDQLAQLTQTRAQLEALRKAANDAAIAAGEGSTT